MVDCELRQQNRQLCCVVLWCCAGRCTLAAVRLKWSSSNWRPVRALHSRCIELQLFCYCAMKEVNGKPTCWKDWSRPLVLGRRCCFLCTVLYLWHLTELHNRSCPHGTVKVRRWVGRSVRISQVSDVGAVGLSKVFPATLRKCVPTCVWFTACWCWFCLLACF